MIFHRNCDQPKALVGRNDPVSTIRQRQSVPLLGHLVSISLLLTGCAANVKETAHDLSKELERGAYDSVAEMLSDYCDTVYDKGLWIQRTRIEARREIRQSEKGRRGPKPPDHPIPGLDEKTSSGTGPILRIWCQGEEVPDIIWQEMVRDWRD